MAVVRVFVQMTPGADCDLAVSGDAISSDVSCPKSKLTTRPVPLPPLANQLSDINPAAPLPLNLKNKHGISAKTTSLSHILLHNSQKKEGKK